MLAKISKSVVDKLEPGSLVWDTALCGFGVRRQLRHPHYIVRYRLDGKQRLVTIGRHGAWTPETARRKAQELLGIVAGGVDPANSGTSTNKEGDAFLNVAERYLSRQRSRLKPRSMEEAERYLRKHSAPLHTIAIAAITRRDVAEILTTIETGSGPVARNRCRSHLCAMFGWAITEGIVENNPALGTAIADENGARERVLDAAEIKALWHACEGDAGRIVRLLLLTGCRRNEITLLDWREVVGDTIVLPGERCKNGRAFTLPLSRQAGMLLYGPSELRSQGRVFATITWSREKRRLDERAGIAEWRLHDLRRTAASGMQRLGVRVEVIERALNHVSGSFRGVAGIYQRDPMTDDVREALQRWADHLDQITKS
jgi:integrase